MRKIERFNKETGLWESIDFQHLIEGDIFRIFDDEERYVNEADGNNVWIAKGKPYLEIPYLNIGEVWKIDTLY